MKSFLLIFLVFLQFTAQSQKISHQIILFESGKSSLSDKNKMKLDSLVPIWKDKDLRLTGHADSIGSEKLNLRISQKRTNSVLNYLLNKGINLDCIHINSVGEKNPIYPNTALERGKNRCVEIQFITPTIEITNEKKPNSVIFENDTLIYGMKGTQIIVPAETYYPLKIKDIHFEITEVFSSCDMLNNNTYTRANNGDCLTSAGMLLVTPTLAGEEILPNKGKMITIKIPTMGGKPDKSMKLYGGVKNKDGEIEWSDIRSEISYEENGNQFYVFKMDSITKINLDKPIGIMCIKDGHKIRTPKKIIGAKICQTYPGEKYLSVAKKLNERRFVLDKVDQAKEPEITIVGYDKIGFAYVAKGPLSELTFRKWRDTYVVKAKYFKRIDEQKKEINEFLCEYLDD